MIRQTATDGNGGAGRMAETIDRELGAITQRLSGIEKRLDEGDRDMQGLMKSTMELTIAVAGLTSRITAFAESQTAARAHESKIVDAMEQMVGRITAPPPATMSPGGIAAVALPSAGGGGLLGAAIWQKISAFLGF